MSAVGFQPATYQALPLDPAFKVTAPKYPRPRKWTPERILCQAGKKFGCKGIGIDLNPERIKEGIDAGAFYYLVKPFQRPLLNSILRAAVSDYHNTRQLLDRLRKHERPLAFIDEATYRIRTIDEASELAVVIASATPDPEHAMVISELIMNAIEHGNLGITYEEKGKLLDQDQWEHEVARRLALPENEAKQVIIRVKKEQDVLRVEIEDEGNGFDYDRYLRIDESRLFDNHGRGIAIAATTLNLRFTTPGNKVVVTLPLASAEHKSPN